MLIHYAQLYGAVVNCAPYVYDTRSAQTHRPVFQNLAELKFLVLQRDDQQQRPLAGEDGLRYTTRDTLQTPAHAPIQRRSPRLQVHGISIVITRSIILTSGWAATSVYSDNYFYLPIFTCFAWANGGCNLRNEF